MVPVSYYLALSAVLFVMGALGVLLRRRAYRSMALHVGDAVQVRCPDHGVRII